MFYVASLNLSRDQRKNEHDIKNKHFIYKLFYLKLKNKDKFKYFYFFKQTSI